VFFNLYPYYYATESHLQAKAILQKNEYQFFLLRLVYALPLEVGIKLMCSNTWKTLIRWYMKFVIRYIFT
jgi:hypothetical protein